MTTTSFEFTYQFEDLNLDLEIYVEVSLGYPPIGPDLHGPGSPEEGAEINHYEVRCEGDRMYLSTKLAAEVEAEIHDRIADGAHL